MYTNRMGGSATVNQPVATHTIASVVTMDVMHPKNWMMIPGNTMSIVSVSREKRLMMRPLGVVSKNAMGNFITRFSKPLCRLFAARTRKK